MLAIEVHFLTGRYVATAYNSRSEAEWPPHPARLFSALAATHFAASSPAREERIVLEWLETLGAPDIHASAASYRDITTVFVPVNDVALTDVDLQADARDEALAALDAAESTDDRKAIKKASVALEKAEKRLKDAIARNVEVSRTGGGNPIVAMRVLPEHRVRQPRTFPSVTPIDAQITYIWPDAQPNVAQRQAIDGLLARLVRLGHSSSLATARIVESSQKATWRPARAGELVLRTVQPGQLAALERAYEIHRETEPRVMPARFQAYTQSRPEVEAAIPRSEFSDDWLVLRRVGGSALPMVSAAGVARTVRKSLVAHTTQVLEMLSGHAGDGSPSERDHLAIVPLPFVGHSRASGAILGVALVLPRSASDKDRRYIYSAVDSWEGAERIEDEDTPSLALRMGAAGVFQLQRIEWDVAQTSLRTTTWCQAARVWLSVTPVALDQNPGDLGSRNSEKLRSAVQEAAQTIRRACIRIGLPQPRDVEILPAPPLAGAAKARHYPPFPEERDRTRRVLTHARLEFSEVVRGPILLGAGRYLGLGLFRPEATRG